MPVSTDELRNARQAVEALLAELSFGAYLYTIEQRNGAWTVTIDYPLDGEWQTEVLPVDPHSLAASLRDPDLHARLLADWQPHLRAGSA